MIPLNQNLSSLKRSAIRVYTNLARQIPDCAMLTIGEPDLDTPEVIKAAAVADYRPAMVADEKMKKKDGALSIPLARTEDILAWVSQNRHPGLFVCGFSMETENMLENSQNKLTKKGLDMIVANNLKTQGAGFGVETNVVTLITRDQVKQLPLMGKDEVAGKLLDEIQKIRS